jgi:CheY-like chemotaxis protein
MAGKPHVLIVEDHPDHREFLAVTLSPQYETTFSSSPEDCLALLDRRPVDLVILDQQLQERGTGAGLCRTITSRYPGLPVIIMAASGNEETAVRAIKAGARDYIRKTPDGDYVREVSDNVRALLGSGPVSPAGDAADLLDFFMRHKKEFREEWKKTIRALREKTALSPERPVSEEDSEALFISFLADLEDETAGLSLGCLRRMISETTVTAGSLFSVELLNTSLKETAREIILRHYQGAPDGRVRFMRRIGTLIDRNDLELCREYERIIAETTEHLLRMERVSTKLLLMRTLEHEIRQPLSYIFNSVELLMAGECAGKADTMLATILDQVKKIENLLFELEKDSEPPLKDYSDNLPIFDISVDNGN